MIKKSRECVINVPTADMIDQVIGIGNCDGDEVDKFKSFHLTPDDATKVGAPLIRECFANLECRIFDAHLVKKYNFFILEVVKAHVATAPSALSSLNLWVGLARKLRGWAIASHLILINIRWLAIAQPRGFGAAPTHKFKLDRALGIRKRCTIAAKGFSSRAGVLCIRRGNSLSWRIAPIFKGISVS